MACELDDAVLEKQIAMFVNDFTLDLGEQGARAIAQLEQLARAAGVVP